jgi:F-type H+-transporting ATPase subunit delta
MSRLAATYAAGVRKLTAGLEKKAAEDAVARFVELLAQRGRLHLGPAIVEAYERAAAEADGAFHVSVTTADALTEKEADALSADLEKTLKRDVRLERAVDPSILGGAVIRYGDVLLDDSLKARLNRLKQQLA